MTLTIIASGTRWADLSLRPLVAAHLDDAVGYLLTKHGLSADTPVRVVEGDGPGEPGVDKLIDSIATERGYRVVRRPAKWTECGDDCPETAHRRPSRRGGSYCPKAGPRRSREMVDEFRGEAKALLAMPDVGSKGASGTWQAIHYAADAGLEILVRPLVVNRRARWADAR